MAQRIHKSLFKGFEDVDLEYLIEEGFLYYVSIPALEAEFQDDDPAIETLLLIPCKLLQQAEQIQNLHGANCYLYSVRNNLSDLFEATQPCFGVRFLIPNYEHSF